MKLLAIYDSDFKYAARLMDYIKKAGDNVFDTAVFSNRDSLDECIRHQKIDILILGETIAYEDMPLENIRHIYCLTDKEEDKQSEYPLIYKYRQAKEVLSDIMSSYSRIDNDDNARSGTGNKSFIGIFTPTPGLSKLSFSWSLVQGISEKKKVLFLPFDLLPVPALYGNDEARQSLSEFIYFLKSESSGIMDRMKDLLSYSGKISYLSGISHGLDLLSITKEDIIMWIEEIKANTDYEATIFFISTYTEATIELMNKCNQCFVLTEDSFYENSIIKVWQKQMDYCGIKELDRFKIITLPHEEPSDKEAFRGFQYNSAWPIGMQYAGKL